MNILSILIAAAAATVPAIASAYSITYNGDKTQATVYCDNGYVAGTLTWNGSTWTNGVGISAADIDAAAKKLIAASGSACK